jgi:hemolysin activation/secretion protein
MPSVAEGSVPNFTNVQRELAGVTGSDRKVTPVLRQGNAPGTVEIDLKVNDQRPFHGSVELNNRETPDTVPLRLQTSLHYDNLWQRDHSVGLQYQVAPQDQSNLRVIVANYSLPLNERRDLLALYAVKSDSNVASVGGSAIIGNGSIVGARTVFSLPPVGPSYQSLSLGMDYKDFGQSVRLGADTFETPIRYVPAVAEYRVAYAGSRATRNLSLSVNTAPRGLFGLNDDTDFENKRANAHANYIYLRGEYTGEEALSQRTAVGVRVQGQLSDQALISNEQFAAGGAESVRGYLEAERLGDNGLVGSLELRRRIAVGSDSVSLTALTFVDGGILTVIDALPGQENRFGLSSAGIGLRMTAWRSIDAALDVAVPFASGPNTEAHSPRAHFRLAAQF